MSWKRVGVAAAGLLLSGAAWAAPEGAQASARAAFAELVAKTPSARAVWRPGRVAPAVLSGLSIETAGETPAARALDFTRRHAVLLGIAPDSLRPAGETRRTRKTIVRLEQRHGALPVRDRGLTVTLDAAGAVIAVTHDAGALSRVEPAVIGAEQARRAAVAAVLGEGEPSGREKVEKVVVATGDVGVEVYEVHVARQPLVEHIVARIDGRDGTLLGLRDEVVR